MSNNTKSDVRFMRRALDLATKGFGKVAPNPMVGAVLVKNGKIIAEGFHKYFGGSHAEVNVLRKLSERQIHGATLFVTLEPCCYFGKTPPCTNFLISSGLERLVIAMRDPNPLVSGRGISQLRKSGVKVRVGVLREEAANLNKVFVTNKLKGLPFLSIKLGVTLDGKIATLKGESKYITNDQSRTYVHRLRSEVDAILTTSKTVIKDNPHLGVRLIKGKDPLRVVIDSNLDTSLKNAVYRDKHVLVATTEKTTKRALALFSKKGVEVLQYKGRSVPLLKLFRDLYNKGIHHIMVEAGSGLVNSLIKERLADELILFIAPKILGQGLPWVTDLGLRSLDSAFKLENIQIQCFGGDIMIQGRLVY